MTAPFNLDKKIFEVSPAIELHFRNWPVIVKEAIRFNNCASLNKKYKEKGLLVCGETEANAKINEAHLCPLVSYDSTLEDGECTVSAYVFEQATKANEEQEIKINGQQFTLKTLS